MSGLGREEKVHTYTSSCTPVFWKEEWVGRWVGGWVGGWVFTVWKLMGLCWLPGTLAQLMVVVSLM